MNRVKEISNHPLLLKAVSVVKSCKTLEQKTIAFNYFNRVMITLETRYKFLPNELDIAFVEFHRRLRYGANSTPL
jgi:hypothetical protein